MISRLLTGTLTAGLLLGAGPCAAGEEPVVLLSNNPFERPAWLIDAREIPGNQPATAKRERLDLRATLTAGKRSMADVGGKILRLGEQIDGYRLIAVTEGEAVFDDGEREIRVTVAEDEQDDDDDS